MAVPQIDWEYWSAPSISPTMQVRIYFPSGVKTYTDDEIEALTFDLHAFDSTETLFGSPVPGTGSISFVDYEQTLNPTYNNELKANIRIELYMGLRDDIPVFAWQPYGVFYAQEWSYDSEGYTATVDFVDSMNEMLLLDNRRDAALPSTNVSLRNFLIQLVELYATVSSNVTYDRTLKFSFYEDSQAATINKACVALMAALFFMPDGSLVLSNYKGFYNTGITLTDDDVDAYDIQQTSTITMDSAQVDANLPSSVESTVLAKFTDTNIASKEVMPFNRDRVMSVDYVAMRSNTQYYPSYEYTVADITYDPTGTNKGILFDFFEVYGHAIEYSVIPVFNTPGTLPYEIVDNPYIQSTQHAQNLVDALDEFINLPFRIITATIRGCYGIWLGAIIRVKSARFNINANYVVIDMSFSYDGAVSTTITMQRV